MDTPSLRKPLFHGLLLLVAVPAVLGDCLFDYAPVYNLTGPSPAWPVDYVATVAGIPAITCGELRNCAIVKTHALLAPSRRRHAGPDTF